jgi:hypothetical protein
MVSGAKQFPLDVDLGSLRLAENGLLNLAKVTESGGTSDNTGTTYSSVGRIGSDVASVVINTIQQGPVTATVHDGYFAAWWPGPALPPLPEKGEPAPPAPAYTVILKDGTIRANIPETQLWSNRQ